MEVLYEDDYSDCQISCIVCGTRTFLLDANYSQFHKICTRCREVYPLNEIRECRECNSKVKVLKYMKNEDEGVKVKERSGFQTVNGPVRVIVNEIKVDNFPCGHLYCGKCKKKNEECVFCRVKLKMKCCICNRMVTLEKKGDFWFCPYCNYYSLECIPCSKFTYLLKLNQKCDLCECEHIQPTLKCGHKYCQTHNKSQCALCTDKSMYTCKFCNIVDVLCKNSICPYCSKKSSNKFCVLCKAQV